MSANSLQVSSHLVKFQFRLALYIMPSALHIPGDKDMTVQAAVTAMKAVKAMTAMKAVTGASLVLLSIACLPASAQIDFAGEWAQVARPNAPSRSTWEIGLECRSTTMRVPEPRAGTRGSFHCPSGNAGHMALPTYCSAHRR